MPRIVRSDAVGTKWLAKLQTMNESMRINQCVVSPHTQKIINKVFIFE